MKCGASCMFWPALECLELSLIVSHPYDTQHEAVVMARRGHKVESLEARENAAVHIGDVYHGREPQENQRHRILTWLNPPSAGAPVRSRREPGTNLWFLDTDLFRSWFNGESRFMFIHGIVGCGKTTLLNSIAKKCRDNRQSHSVVATFYFSSTVNEGLDLHALLCFLVSQLCEQDAVPLPLDKLHAIHNRSFPPTPPSDEELEEVVTALLCQPRSSLYRDDVEPNAATQKAYLLVDGLDEIRDRSVRRDVIRYLNELCHLDTSMIHVLVTSRPEADFLTSLRDDRGWRVVAIPKNSVRADIEIFVRREMAKHSELDDLDTDVQAEVLARLAGPEQAM